MGSIIQPIVDNSTTKGQSAIEYLMTYGWMLLVVAIVGGAVFSVVGDQSIESVSGFSGSEIDIRDFGLTEDGLAFAVRNTGSDSIEIKKVRLTNPSTGFTNKVDLSESISVGESGNIEISGVESSEGTEVHDLEVFFDSGKLKNLSVSGTITGGLNIYNQDCNVVTEGSGEYKIDPDGKGGISAFEVYCDMETDGGGWIKIRMDNRKNQYWWTKKNSDINDGETRDPGGSTYSEWNWTPFNHIGDNSDIGTYDFARFEDEDIELDLTWHQWNNSDNTYTRSQMDAIRSRVDKISSTTEAFSTSSDDDGCRNGEAVLKLTEGGTGYQITHYTSSTGQFIRNFETVSEMNKYNDVRYLVPAVLEYENGGGCSGGADFVAFGYEKNYTLIK